MYNPSVRTWQAMTATAVLGTLLSLGTATYAQVPQYPQTVPGNSVVGRIGPSSGPTEAIPFSTLLTQLQGLPGFMTGPNTTVIGTLVTWGNLVGTLTNSYAGTACTNGAITSLSVGGIATCLPARAATQKNVASPAGPNSTSVYTMQGLGGTITPTVTGNLKITISGTVNESAVTAGHGLAWQISYGTSTAPGANGALAGTQVGVVQEYLNPTTVTAADVFIPFSLSVVVTGLTVGTPYWIDLAAKAIVATDGSLVNISISATEI